MSEALPLRIVIADDNRDTVDSLAMLLRLSGHEVRACYGGLDAIEAASEWHPDLMLVDLAMPKVHGIRVAIEVRENFNCQKTVLAAVSGMHDPEHRRIALEAGFSHYLVKPVEQAELLRVLAAAQEKRR